MAKHKGDMLEALRATLRSAREDAQGEPETTLPDPTPAAQETPAPASAPPTPSSVARRPVQQELEDLDRRIAAARTERPASAMLVLYGAALVAAFLLGRFSAPDPVQAEEGATAQQAGAPSADEQVLEDPAPEPTRPTQSEVLETVPTSALLAPSSDPARDDRAFQDPANTHSVLAIQWVDSERNLELAFGVYDDFRLRGLPAITPLRVGNKLMLFVGAARGREALSDIATRVRQSSGPDGKMRPYETAYVTEIETYRAP